MRKMDGEALRRSAFFRRARVGSFSPAVTALGTAGDHVVDYHSDGAFVFALKFLELRHPFRGVFRLSPVFARVFDRFLSHY